MVGFLETGYKIRNSNSSYMLDMVSEPEVVGTSSLCYNPHSRSEATIVVVLMMAMMVGFTVKLLQNFMKMMTDWSRKGKPVHYLSACTGNSLQKFASTTCQHPPFDLLRSLPERGRSPGIASYYQIPEWGFNSLKRHLHAGRFKNSLKNDLNLTIGRTEVNGLWSLCFAGDVRHVPNIISDCVRKLAWVKTT